MYDKDEDDEDIDDEEEIDLEEDEGESGDEEENIEEEGVRPQKIKVRFQFILINILSLPRKELVRKKRAQKSLKVKVTNRSPMRRTKGQKPILISECEIPHKY